MPGWHAKPGGPFEIVAGDTHALQAGSTSSADILPLAMQGAGTGRCAPRHDRVEPERLHGRAFTVVIQ